MGPFVIKVKPSRFIVAVQLALRASVAAAVSLAIAKFLGLQPLIFAFIAAVIVTDLDPAQSRQLGLRRIVATVIGALCGAIFSQLIPANPWTIGLATLVTMLICELLRVPDGAKVAAFTCGIIMLIPGEAPWVNALDRFAETIIGVVVAWSVSYVPKLIRVEEPQGSARLDQPGSR